VLLLLRHLSRRLLFALPRPRWLWNIPARLLIQDMPGLADIIAGMADATCGSPATTTCLHGLTPYGCLLTGRRAEADTSLSRGTGVSKTKLAYSSGWASLRRVRYIHFTQTQHEALCRAACFQKLCQPHLHDMEAA
jgi:hypothetical protein